MANGSLATTEQKSGGIMDMSGGTADMAMRLAEMSDKLDLVKTFFKTQMAKDIDFGIIPGTDKPALFKAGAEKLCALYGFSQRVLDKTETRDIATGYYLAEVTVQLTHAASGIIVADGVGECSSYESKYRYRWVFESDVPKNIDKAGLVSKTFESKKTGKEFTRYRLENPDLIDQWNTVLKMAKKRALVDATLAATRTSGMFCQTEGELDAWMDGDEIPKQEKLEKQKPGPAAADEKSSFNPSAFVVPNSANIGAMVKAVLLPAPLGPAMAAQVMPVKSISAAGMAPRFLICIRRGFIRKLPPLPAQIQRLHRSCHLEKQLLFPCPSFQTIQTPPNCSLHPSLFGFLFPFR